MALEQNPQLVVFDWSGTVSFDLPPVYEANMEILRQSGKPTMDFESWKPRTRLTAAEFLISQGVAGATEELLAWYEWELALAKERGVTPTAYTDAHATLSFLAGKDLRIAVLSSHPENHLREEADEYGLTGFIKLFVGDSKDKVMDLARIMERFGIVNSQRALMVGDTIYDIQAGKRWGTLTAAVTTGYHSRKRLAAENPDLLSDNLTGIRLWFDGGESNTSGAIS